MRNLYIFLLFILFGCNSTKKIKSYEDFKSQTLEEVNKNSSLENIKIENSDYLYIYHPYGIYTNNFCAVFSTINYSKKEFDAELKIIKSKYKNISIKNEKCLQYIPEEGITTKKETCDEILLPNINDSLVVPKNILTNNISYYIKNESKGMFLKKEYTDYFKSKNNLYHGYSSGAIIDNENFKIIYWLIIK